MMESEASEITLILHRHSKYDGGWGKLQLALAIRASSEWLI